MRRKKAGFITKMVVLILAVYATVTLIDLRTRIEEAEMERAELTETVQEKTASNAGLQYEIEHCNDPKTIENIARDKLGLMLPGERVFYEVGN